MARHSCGKRFLIVVYFICSLSALAACSFHKDTDPAQRAESLLNEGQYDEAIAEYRQHMQDRLNASSRPDWENPYFYMIVIGDIQLEHGSVADALTSYETAEQHGVEAPLVADRYRYVAKWYEDHGELKQAMEFLKKYRDRDPLLFDGMLDRVGRKMSAEEDAHPEL